MPVNLNKINVAGNKVPVFTQTTLKFMELNTESQQRDAIVQGRSILNTPASVFFLSIFYVVFVFLGVGGMFFAMPLSWGQTKTVSAIPDTEDGDASVPADKLFPDSTKGFVAIQDLKLLVEQWKKTQIGLLLQDPIMKPFREDFGSQLEKRMENQLGLNLEGIDQLPSGEVAFGMISIPETIPGYVFTMDTADRRGQVANYIDGLTKKFLAIGVKRSVEKYKDDEIIVFTFPAVVQEVLKKDDNKTTTEKPTTEPTTRQTTPRNNTTTRNRTTRTTPEEKEKNNNVVDIKAKNSDSNRQKVYYLLKSDYLVISNQLHLIRLFSDRISAGYGVKNSLADVKEYQEVLSRCLLGIQSDSLPMIHWYIDPLDYGESMRVLLRNPEADKRKAKKSVFASLKEQGFDAIRGVGGTVSIKPANREVAYRVFAYTVKPYRLAMKMLNLPNGTNFTPPQWIPADAARCSVMLVDPIMIFDNLGTLFDELVAQGESGVFNDIIEGLAVDPRGPRVDVREEFIVNLGSRAFTMSNYSKPISPDSESLVIAVEVKEPDKNKKTDELDPADKIKKAVEKIFKNDSDMMQTNHKGYIIWHRAPVKDIKLPIVVISVPSLDDDSGIGDYENNKNETPPVFPEGGITVTPKYLLASTNVEYLKKIIDRLEAKDGSIIEHVDYKATGDILESLGLDKTPHFAQFFSKSDESLEPTYELMRQGKMPQSKAIFGRLINAILLPDNEDNSVREQEFNWEKLPEFDKIRHAFGPAALYGESVENGFLFEGFLLKKNDNNKNETKETKETREAKEVKEKPVKKDEKETNEKTIETN
ncbi:MAG: hypothetical protein LBJ00_11750 [Planctomycetaceae bacterium]|jgi:hypothetical protein|nr:hypothetical protein [Planctomycetaceae bacterium]